MKNFRVHFRNGNSITITAHHFGPKSSSSSTATIPFYKDESTVDENILVFVAEVGAIVPQEPSEPPQLPESMSYQSY